MFVQFVILRIEDSEVIGMICEECRKLTKWKSSSSSSFDGAHVSLKPIPLQHPGYRAGAAKDKFEWVILGD